MRLTVDTQRFRLRCYVEIESKFCNTHRVVALSSSEIIRGPNWQDYSCRRPGHVLEIAGITRL